jgi:16S rRNA (guanine1207-N2)-methyltransferase
MADRRDLEFTYSLIDRIFRLSLGEMADFSGAKYDGDFSMTLEQAQRRKHEFIAEQIGIGPGRRLLDLGCGWGPIALAMALDAPDATVWAVDVNARALALTADNATALGLTGVRAVSPVDVPADLELDVIWSNPPIRIGKEALHALLLQWIPRLRPGGVAYLVVQRNLGSDSLHAWLRTALADLPDLPDQEYDVERLGSAKGYRVLEVTRLR